MAVLEPAMSNRVSLAELAAADIRLRPGEAVTIVSAICEQHLNGSLPGIPSPGVIRLTRDGHVIVEGPITTADVVVRAALLLTDLLPGYDALPEYRASGALRLVIARGLGSIDLPPYASLDEFRAALARFATEDVAEVSRALFSAWERARVARDFKAAPRSDLTISDVRRARRATGLSLNYLAGVAEVPSTRLRDLEWGYMREWPATTEARTQVIRYARAAGLDESIVLSIAWPMILESASVAYPASTRSVALVPAPPKAIAVVEPVPVAAKTQPDRWRAAVVAAAALVALLGAYAVGWRSSPRPLPTQDAVQVGLSGQDAAPIVRDRDGEAPAAPAGARAGVIHAADVRLAAEEPEARTLSAPPRVKPAAAPAKAKQRRTPPPSRASDREAPREPQKKKSFFERELFRIVIR